MAVLQIGAGGVGWALAHKLAQNNDVFGEITLASRTVAKCERIIESVHRKGNLKDARRGLNALSIDADDVPALVQLIKQVAPDLVANVGPPWINCTVMEACCEAGVAYMDTSVATDLCSPGQQVPEAYDPQWALRDKFSAAGVPGILSSGFDPGVVSVFCAYAKKHLFDSIDSIDVIDVNAGNHGRKFATNFDPETNLLEIQGDSFYWDEGEWRRVPCHSRMREVDLPVVGKHKVYSMAHDEVRSLVEFMGARHVEFWMGFSDRYLGYFNALRDVGMLSPHPVTTSDGITVSPLRVLKAVLPEPTSLAANYTGMTCIGSLVEGMKDGRRRKVFLYNLCDHKKCYEEIESQAISYTTGVPAATGAMMFFLGHWREPGLRNVEQLDPDPYLEWMPKLGLTWEIQELPV
ncbi:MAG: saccharopine dehydrogenase family protein [Pirellulales bacterium]